MKTFTIMIVAFTTTILLATQVLQMTNNHASATTSPTIVQAGEATTPLAVFSPQTVEINAGESVTWTNPTKVAEPHTITFYFDNSTEVRNSSAPCSFKYNKIHDYTTWLQ